MWSHYRPPPPPPPQTKKWGVRVEDVEYGVDDVGDEVDVALSASSARVHAEGLLGGEAEE